MPAETITRGRLRRLADVRPERGRVLSVFLNLDPAQFATPAARSTAITSVMTEAAHRVDDADGLAHDEREALKVDVQRVREALGASDIASNGTRAVAVYACQPANLLEVVALRRPVESGVVLERSPYVEPLVADMDDERWSVLLVNRRNGRLFIGHAHALEETDRVEDDVHSQHDKGGWSQANYQRSVEKEKVDHLVRVADVAFAAYKERGFDRLLVGAPEELVHELEAKLHPYLRERIAGRLHVDVDNSSLDEVRTAARKAIEDWARRCERQELDRLIEGVGRGGRGVAGLRDVQRALDEARVEVLLLAEGLDGAEPAIEKAIEQSAKVIVVRHHDDLVPLGGIGAVLRY
jgi:peptide chain release factor subunit 1